MPRLQVSAKEFALRARAKKTVNLLMQTTRFDFSKIGPSSLYPEVTFAALPPGAE